MPACRLPFRPTRRRGTPSPGTPAAFVREALSAVGLIASFVAPGLVVAALAPPGGGPAALLPAPLRAGSGATSTATERPPGGGGTPPAALPGRGAPGPGGSGLGTPYLPGMPPLPSGRPDRSSAPAPPAGAEAPPSAPAGPGPALWVLDGYNVLQVALLRGEERQGFWRREARERLVALARRLAAGGIRVRIVFDGPHPAAGATAPPAVPPPVEVVFAPSADTYLLALAPPRASAGDASETRPPPGARRLVAVTADRRLAARLRHRGIEVRTPGDFVAACAALGDEAEDGGAMPA